VFEELKSATKKRYYSVVYITIGLTIIFLFLIGVGGYTLFGERALETTTVLSLFPNHDVLGTVCKLFFIIDLFFSIPFQLFMPRLGLKFMAVSMYPQLRTDKQKSNTFFYASTIFVTVLSLIISIAVEDLGAVFEICGGVSACALAYIIPPLIALKVSNLSNANKFFCVTILFIGTTILLCSLVASIKRLVL
jgi:amino acid permease